MRRRFKTVSDIAAWRLCAGCGACAAACPEKAISLVDIVDQGIRPRIDPAKCNRCGECVDLCPGVEISHKQFNGQTIPDLRQSWGPVLELWDGYAKDPEIRYNGSSGGVATALALYCLETGRFSGALHVRAKLDVPLQNTAVLSKTREDLLAGAGSRYSPAAPCERFDLIEQAESDCVFIGKPCDVAALRKSQSVNAALASKVGLVISIFCAATPCSQGTQVLLESLGVEPEDVAELRYRGCGWPGMTVVKLKGANGRVTGMSYEQSWGKILSRYGQLRCRLCPDSTGELADISCGDPWYREIEPEEPGRSLVLVRTERGRKTLREAMDKDYIVLERVGWSILPRSQMSLLEKRRNIFGRLFSMKLLGVPTPKFRGFSLFANWRVLSLTDKIRSIGGTMRRIVWRGWFRPRNHSHPM